MGYSASTKILTGAGFNKTNVDGLSDLQRALGRSGGGSHIQLVGDLSVDGQNNVTDAHAINPFAIHKPIRWGGVSAPTNAQKATANYGLVLPELTLQQVFTEGTAYAWKYDKPDGSTYPLRATDFISKDNPSTRGYYADAPRNVLCCYRDTDIDINVVNEYAYVDSIVFCAFSKNGDASTNAIFDKKPSATSGVSTTSYGHTTAQLQCAIGIEDITTSNSNTLYGSNHRLGIALKKGNNYSFLACPEDLVNNAALLDIDRFMIDSGELRDLTPGTYTAVGCLRIFDLQAASYKYIPLHPKDWSNAAGEKNSFQINVGGAEYYQVSTVGVGKEDTDTPAASCSSNSIAYITLRVKNISASQHLTTAHTYGDWACRAHIVGSYVDDNDVTTSLDFYLEPGIYSVDGVKSSESQVFTISPNATIDMMFMLNGVFGNSTAVSRIISGQVTVSPEMRFSGDPFISLYRPCTINFAR